MWGGGVFLKQVGDSCIAKQYDLHITLFFFKEDIAAQKKKIQRTKRLVKVSSFEP